MKSPLAEKRQGVCLGLGEVIGASTRKQIEDFLVVLIPAVQDALCDPAPEVRTRVVLATLTFVAIGVSLCFRHCC